MRSAFLIFMCAKTRTERSINKSLDLKSTHAMSSDGPRGRHRHGKPKADGWGEVGPAAHLRPARAQVTEERESARSHFH